MFGQNLLVGSSSLPIDQSLLQRLATEMDVNRHLSLSPDVRLEDAKMINVTFKTLVEQHLVGFKTPEEKYHSEGFKTDATEAYLAAMIKKQQCW
jgi:ferredoxin-NADP reductase